MQRRVPGRTENLFELLWVHGSSLDAPSRQDFRAHGLSVLSTNQLAQLQALGCTCAQGYLISRPVDPVAARAILARPAPRSWTLPAAA